jgi:hypothetical protein
MNVPSAFRNVFDVGVRFFASSTRHGADASASPDVSDEGETIEARATASTSAASR